MWEEFITASVRHVGVHVTRSCNKKVFSSPSGFYNQRQKGVIHCSSSNNLPALSPYWNLPHIEDMAIKGHHFSPSALLRSHCTISRILQEDNCSLKTRKPESKLIYQFQNSSQGTWGQLIPWCHESHCINLSMTQTEAAGETCRHHSVSSSISKPLPQHSSSVCAKPWSTGVTELPPYLLPYSHVLTATVQLHWLPAVWKVRDRITKGGAEWTGSGTAFSLGDGWEWPCCPGTANTDCPLLTPECLC